MVPESELQGLKTSLQALKDAKVRSFKWDREECRQRQRLLGPSPELHAVVRCLETIRPVELPAFCRFNSDLIKKPTAKGHCIKIAPRTWAAYDRSLSAFVPELAAIHRVHGAHRRRELLR